MGEEPGQRSKRKIDAALDKSNQARVSLQKFIELHCENWPPGTINLLRYSITPRNAPKWAKTAWWQAIAQAEKDGANDTVMRKLARAKIDDLCDLVANLDGASPSLKDEWERFYPTWVAQEVARIRDEHATKPRHDPSSLRSIIGSLPDRQRRTALAYRALKCRKSRGAGQRKRGPSYKALAIQSWERAHEIDAAIVHGILAERQEIAGLGQKYGLANGAVLERLRLGLDGLQNAIDAAKALKGIQEFPQETVEGKAQSGVRRLKVFTISLKRQ